MTFYNSGMDTCLTCENGRYCQKVIVSIGNKHIQQKFFSVCGAVFTERRDCCKLRKACVSEVAGPLQYDGHIVWLRRLTLVRPISQEEKQHDLCKTNDEL